jgi:hypothetical protein
LRTSIVAAFVVIFTQASASRALADPKADSAEWLARWSDRRQLCKAVAYDLSGSVTIPAGFYKDIVHPGETFPPARFTYRRRIKITLDFVNRRARRDEQGMTWQLNERKFIPYCEIDLFDGRRFQTVRPRAENSSASWQPRPYDAELIEQGERSRGPFFTEIDLPILFAHGLVATTNDALSPDRLLAPPDSGSGSLPSQFAPVQREGPSLLLLKSKPPAAALTNHDEVGVDLDRGGAVIGWSAFVDGKQTTSIAIKHK